MPNPEGSQGRQWLTVTTRCSPRCSTTNPRPSPTVITVPLGFSLSAGLIALIRASSESSCAALRILGRNHSWMWLPYLGCACPSRCFSCRKGRSASIFVSSGFITLSASPSHEAPLAPARTLRARARVENDLIELHVRIEDHTCFVL